MSTWIFLVISLVVLAVFQFLGMSIDLFGNQYEINRYAKEAVSQNTDVTTNETVSVYADEPLAAVDDACAYMKKSYVYYDTFGAQALDASVVVIAKPLSPDQSELLLAACRSGISVIFAGMPSIASEDEDPALWNLLGLNGVGDTTDETTGLRMYDGFLLGGQITYEDINDRYTHYQLRVGCRVFAAGLLGDPDDPEVEIAPVLWRVGVEGGYAFVISTDLMRRHAYAGIFSAAYAQVRETTVYPVVNAQALLIDNFPFLTEENTDTLRAFYHQSCSGLFINRLLPDISATLNLYGYPMSCTFSGSLDYTTALSNRAQWSMLREYIRLIIGRQGEMGVSAFSLNEGTHTKKLLLELTLHNREAKGYTLTVLARDNMPLSELKILLRQDSRLSSIQTVVASREEDMERYEYLTPKVVQVPSTVNLNHFDDHADLEMRGMQTLTLSCVMKGDIERVIYPTGTNDDWVNVHEEWTETLSAASAAFKDLSRVNVTEAGARARNMLNSSVAYKAEGDTTTLAISGATYPAYFLYRRAGYAITDAVGA